MDHRSIGSLCRRSRLQQLRDAHVATKFGMAVDDQRKGARPEYVRQACDDSLRRLATGHIDLYQLHQPDPGVPIARLLVVDENGGERVLGEYTFNHTRTIPGPPGWEVS
jgi:aryl-alcohol dehydrogenase-like predicted oxidoreductase